MGAARSLPCFVSYSLGVVFVYLIFSREEERESDSLTVPVATAAGAVAAVINFKKEGNDDD